MGITVDTIKDIGPQPQSFDIERETKENTTIVRSLGAGAICK